MVNVKNQIQQELDIVSKYVKAPLLIVNTNGYVKGVNLAFKELFNTSNISEKFLLKHCENTHDLISYIKSVNIIKKSESLFLQKVYLDEEHLSEGLLLNLKIDYLEDDFCVIKMERSDSEDKLEIKYRYLLKHADARIKCFSTLMNFKEDSVTKCLQNLLVTTHTSGIYIFENFTDAANNNCCRCIERKCNNSPLFSDEINLSKIGFKNKGLRKWEQELSGGGLIYGDINSFSDFGTNFFDDKNKHDILIVPLFVDHRWYGSILYDWTEQDYDLAVLNIDFLKAISAMFANYYSILEYRSELTQIGDSLISANNSLSKEVETRAQLVSIMTHDIKNPLDSIQGFSDLLVNDFDDFSNEQVNDFIRIINSCSKSLELLVENISFWIRSNNADIEAELKDFDLEEVTKETLSLVNGMAVSKSIKLINNVKKECFICSDSRMLFTIIRNLIINAIKFTPENGNVFIDEVKKDESLLLCISDDGVGMTQEKASFLFTNSNTISQKGTNGERGIGLGLKVCRMFVEKLNGEIWAESQQGCGSKFYVKLPC